MAVDFSKIESQDFPFLSGVSIGRIPYADYIIKFGKNDSVGTAAFEDVWEAGGVETLLTAAETMDIVSTSAEDSADGDGTRTVMVKGLNNNYEFVNEEVTLDGLTPVTTTVEFLRVFRVFGNNVGSNGANLGTITVTASVTGSEHAELEIGENQTQKTQFTIPAGYYGLWLDFHASALKNDQYSLEFRLKTLGMGERTILALDGFESLAQVDFPIPRLLPPKSDFKARAINTASGQVSLTVFYTLLFVKEEMVNTQFLKFQ